MDIFPSNPIVEMLSPVFGWLIVFVFGMLVLRVLVEVVLPDLYRSWRNKRQFKAGAQWRSDRDLIQWIRGMSPKEFEDYIAELFIQLGYQAEAVGKSYDGGIDVIATKNGVTNYIQCKRYITRQVPVSAIRDFYGAIAGRLANGQAYFITTAGFTLEARKFAEDKPIELIDQYRLLDYIKLATPKDSLS